MTRRLGAVSYLNSRPLVEGLDTPGGPFEVRFDLPSRCAALLHEGAIDLGLIPSIEYLARDTYVAVPGVSVASEGPVASVALFSRTPLNRVRRVALDTSSRTSATLLRILFADWFQAQPVFETAPPNLDAMLATHDAALLIGDPALFTDHEARGLSKIDLGEQWLAFTGLPFVWALWVGRVGAVDDSVCAALGRARDLGVAAIPRIASDYSRGDTDTARRVETYLRTNIRYGLDDRHEQALQRFYASAGRLGLVQTARELRFSGRERQVATP